jgi:hypothetical protein
MSTPQMFPFWGINAYSGPPSASNTTRVNIGNNPEQKTDMMKKNVTGKIINVNSNSRHASKMYDNRKS